ncbi:MAG: hypothetical protein ABIW31_06395 [Novosphingobium sp.]
MPIGPHSSAIAAAILLGGVPLGVQIPSWQRLSSGEMAVASSAMVRLNLAGGGTVIRRSVGDRSVMAAPTAENPPELVVRFAPRTSRARIELGALGGGRADAPGLVHVGLGMNF